MLRVPDGGTIALDITPPNHESLPADAPTILVNHGLTGNANESYVRNVLAWVVKPKSEGGLGGRGVVVNVSKRYEPANHLLHVADIQFRGCGGTPVTSTQLYSAAASVDTNTAAHYLRATFPQSAIHGIGFSLGASVLARYLGEAGGDSLLSSGCVLACPWDVVELSHALEDGWFSSRVYSRALGQNLIRLFFRAYDANPELFEADDSRCKDVIQDMRDLRKLGAGVRLKKVDDVLTTLVGGPSPPFPFKNADAYYAYAGSHQLIHNVKV
jgi:predicted alpha/beta-fold hydrolase